MSQYWHGLVAAALEDFNARTTDEIKTLFQPAGALYVWD